MIGLILIVPKVIGIIILMGMIMSLEVSPKVSSTLLGNPQSLLYLSTLKAPTESTNLATQKEKQRIYLLLKQQLILRISLLLQQQILKCQLKSIY